MRKDQLSRMAFGTPVSAALVSATPEVMTIPIPARPQDSGFILVMFSDCGSGNLVLSSIGLSLGAETEAYDNITLDCSTYATPALLLPFSPTAHGLFSGPTVTLTFTPTATLGSTNPVAIALAVEFPIDGAIPPAAALGTYTAVLS